MKTIQTVINFVANKVGTNDTFNEIMNDAAIAIINENDLDMEEFELEFSFHIDWEDFMDIMEFDNEALIASHILDAFKNFNPF